MANRAYILARKNHGDPAVSENLHDFRSTLARLLKAHGYTVRIIFSQNLFSTIRLADHSAIYFSYHTTGKIPNTIHYKESYLPGHFYLDRLGYSGWSEWSNRVLTSSFPEISDIDIDEICKRLRNDIFELGRSKYDQPLKFDNTIPNRYVFFPMQMKGDTVEALSHIDTESLLRAAPALSECWKIPIVLKRHPKCNDPLFDYLISQALKAPGISIAHAPVNFLISNAEAVLTVNSGVGFESLLTEVPVISTGDSDYVEASISAKNIGALKALSIEKIIVNQSDRKRFLARYVEFCTTTAEESKLLRKLHALHAL